MLGADLYSNQACKMNRLQNGIAHHKINRRPSRWGENLGTPADTVFRR
jgi:hypothetical protein